MKKNLFKLNRVATLLVVTLFSVIIVNNMIAQDDNNLSWEIYNFNFLIRTAVDNYVDTVNAHKLVEGAIKNVLSQLDPYSFYMPPEEKKASDESFQGHFDGIGVQFSVIEDTITIIDVLSGGPCKKVGVLPGDKIVKINDTSAVGVPQSSIPKKLKGPKGTKVNIDIKREGEKDLIKFDIIRDKIPVYSVDASFIIDGTDIGYLAINRFMETTHKEFKDSMAVLKHKGMKKLILDLRGNPGGYMDQAFMLVNEFVPGGNVIVFTKGRNPGFNQQLVSTGGGEYEHLPLIVLVDAGSASASEIFSGAIQDLDRGLIVGETSFGKGLVQRQFDLEGGAAFRLTTSKYYTPSGRCVQRPYEDKERFKRMEDRLNLSEGANMNHELEKIAENNKGDSSFPIFKTKSGRPVLGAGGISPDFIVKYDTITPLSLKILRKSIFYTFVATYLKENTDIKKKYFNNFSAYYNKFEVDDAMYKEFKKVVESRGVEWNEEEAKTDDKYIRITLKAIIARSIWDNNEYTMVNELLTRHVKKAIELFPEAEKISKIK